MDKDNLVEQLFLSKSKVEDTIAQMVDQNKPGRITLTDAGRVEYYIYLQWELKGSKAVLEMNILDADEAQIGKKVKSSVQSKNSTLIEDLQFLYGDCMYQILDDLQKS